MSWEAWGTPEDPEPIMCNSCDNELGSSTDCQCCKEASRADKAQSELSHLRVTLAHRLRIMRSRKVYEDGKKENGISVEMLMSQSLLFGIPGILFPHEVDDRLVAEAEKALLVFENARYMYSTQPGCNCLHDNKPHPIIHAETCPYRITYSAAWERAREARVEPVEGPLSEPARSDKTAPESSSAAPVEAVEVPKLAPSDEQMRNMLFEAGWRTAAKWANRDDLYADTGSAAYARDRDAVLAELDKLLAQPSTGQKT